MEAAHVELPASLSQFVASRLVERGHADFNDYVISLIQADHAEQQRLSRIMGDQDNQQKIESMLDQAWDETTEPVDMDAIRQEVRQRLGNASEK